MLNPGVLRESLRPLFVSATMPQADAVVHWARAYVRYAQSATAGVCSPSTLSPVPAGGDFFQALDSSFRAMWLAAAWVGPGFTGTTSFVPSLAAAMAANAPRLIGSYDPDFALSIITESLHSYTLSILVTVVSAGGTPTTVPLA